jgi:hypothetical protein
MESVFVNCIEIHASANCLFRSCFPQQEARLVEVAGTTGIYIRNRQNRG